MDRETIKKTAIQVAAEVFSVQKNSIGEDLKAGTIEAWDSLGHLKFFLALENKFKVKFSTDEILKTSSIGDLIDKLIDKL